ncbi:MAG TPA: aminoglycoside phosphotransferase family protein [Roseiflexaceae bacterium]|nr:aminoglycoside phosphotransferase family protein [Roseiflexaceae bacterium]
MNPPGDLSPEQIAGLLTLAGIAGPGQATLLKRRNHVWRVTAGDDVFFLKVYTKDWYGGDVAATAGCVEHEVAAWRVLQAHGIATPEVVAESRECANPIGRPFLMTRRLRGTSLTTLLRDADASEFAALLEASGAFLRRVHAITFERAGYLMDAGPWAPSGPDAWQHWLWLARQTQRDAFATLEADRPLLSPQLCDELAARFATIEDALAAAWQPPRFTHGDCHAEQFFLYEDGGWQVSGFVDLEVASAGDCAGDLLKFAIEMMVHFVPATRWWEPFFAGYSGAPDFELFRLRLLGWHATNFTAHGAARWPASREQTQRRFLAARDWAELFAK